MNLSDVIGTGALVVSVGSIVVAGLAWTTSRRSAIATERQAAAAEQQTELLRQQMETERRHRQQEATGTDEAAQARLVFVELSGMGGLAVHVTNQSSTAVSYVQLDDVRAEENPVLTWRTNPRVIGQQTVREVLTPGESAKFFVEFADEDGNLVRFAGQSYAITYSFTDASGRRWRRTGNDEPTRTD